MAKLLLDWLNDLRLSRDVTSLDEDFRTGYLLGELLSRYNQQSNFDLFVDKDTPDAKINNFCLVEPTVRRIGITFNSKIAFDIINAKPGTMRSLLYEFKVALDRISKRSASVQPEVDGDMKKTKILRVVQPSRPIYDKTLAVTFENAIRAMMDNPNDLMMERTLQKYQQKHMDFRTTILTGHTQTLDSVEITLRRQKDIERSRKQHEKEFAQAWDNINVDQWKQNQKKARERRQLVQRLDMQATSKHETRALQYHESNRDHTLDSIAIFDRRLETEIIPEDPDISKTVGKALKKVVAGEQGMGLPTLTYIDNTYLQAGLVSAQKSMKEQSEDMHLRQQAHDRRRKKFTRERESMQSSFLHRSAESIIVSQLLNSCQAEKFEDSAKDSVMKFKQVMSENKYNRDVLILKYDDDAAEQANIWQAQQAEREKVWVINSRMKAQSERAFLLEHAHASADRQQSLELAREIVDRLLEVTDWACSCRHFGLFKDPSPSPASSSALSLEARVHDGSIEAAVTPNDEILPAYLWSDIRRVFSSHLPVSEALPLPQPSNVSEHLPHLLSHRPHAVEMDWLLKAPLETHMALTCRFEPAGDDQVAQKPSLPHGEKSITHHLASDDSCVHFDEIANVEIPGGFENPPDTGAAKEAAAAAAIAAKDAMGVSETGQPMSLPSKQSHPAWLLDTPSKHLLGDVLIDVRCVADPLPDDPPAPDDVPVFQHRYAICGTSDFARKAVTASLVESVGGLVVLQVEALTNSAIKVGQETEGVVPMEEWSPDQALAVEILSLLLAGELVPDDKAVALLVQAIKAIPPESPGYVIEDFPNTKTQAILLLQALSGINYDDTKPQPLHKKSSFAPPAPRDALFYDPAKCGLKSVILLDSGDVEVGTREKVAARQNMRNGERAEITADTNSVVGLQEFFTPNRPAHTTSIELTIAQQQMKPLRELLLRMEIAMEIRTVEFGGVAKAAIFVARQLAPPLEIEVTDSNEIDVEEEVANADVAAASTTAAVGAVLGTEADVLGDEDDEGGGAAVVAPLKDVALVPAITPLPQQLGTALTAVWNEMEIQSHATAREFFNGLRDLRYQVVQRRRVVHDVLHVTLTRRDNKQNIVEDFRSGFNEIENDFRFDVDCQAELQLRALELGNSLDSLCDKRKQEAETLLTSLEDDAMALTAIHRAKCEGAAMLQCDLARFNTSLHILFDYTKAVGGLDYTKYAYNALEETLPLSVGSASASAAGDATKGGKTGKEAAKTPKGKDVGPPPPVPYREPVFPSLLPEEAMSALPLPRDRMEEAAAADPKAKGKVATPKAPPSDPFETMEKLVLDKIAPFGQGTFFVNRLLYGEEEALCIALETAVWHEAERLKACVAKVRGTVEAQAKWIEDMEASLFQNMRELVKQRYVSELSVSSRLISMVAEAIEECEPLKHEWLVAPDAVSVMHSRLVVPAAEPPPIPHVVHFHNDHLNEEQIHNIQQWLKTVATGSVILEADMHSLLDQGFSWIGPLGNTVMPNGSMLVHLTFPKAWRSLIEVPVRDGQILELEVAETESVAGGGADIDLSEAAGTGGEDRSGGEGGALRRGRETGLTMSASAADLLRKALVPVKKLPGVDEHVGAVSLESVNDQIVAGDILQQIV